jgi:hypothetical protein
MESYLYLNLKDFFKLLERSKDEKTWNLSYILVADFFGYDVLKNIFMSIRNIERQMGYMDGALSDFRDNMEKQLIQRICNEYGLQFAKIIEKLL